MGPGSRSRSKDHRFPDSHAVADYAYLRDHGYPPRPSLALVGDRYRLTRYQRAVLYRGVCSATEATRRMARLIAPEALGEGNATEVTIDGYNVLLTIYHYLTGYPVFMCRDGLVRDAGLSHGRTARSELLEEAARGLFDQVASLAGICRVVMILDEAVSHSRDHAALLRDVWSDAIRRQQRPNGSTIELEVRLSPSADADLAAVDRGVLATSDSQVIERSPLPVIDLPRLVVENVFGAIVAGDSVPGERIHFDEIPPPDEQE